MVMRTDSLPLPQEGDTLNNAWRTVKAYLESANIQDADFDANQLIIHATNCDRRLNSNKKLTLNEAQQLQKNAKLRKEHTPLQYIIGEWDFLNFTLQVGEGVLIPRADTEIVCETAIQKAIEIHESTKEKVKIIDLCAGSGAISIGVKLNAKFAEVTAVELSKDALKWLEKNVENLAPEIEVVNQDVFIWQQHLQKNSVDIIVSNPPYITAEEMKTLEKELSHEPQMALFAQENGLAFYKHIAKEYKSAIKKGGYLIFEIGSTQANSVSEILRMNNYENIQVIKDYSGNNRCVVAIAK